MTVDSIFLNNPLGTEITLTDVEESFEFLDDWEERYAYVIDLGKKLPAFPEDQKTEDNKVHGCQSQVWMIYQYDPANKHMYLLLDSDALIVKGLAAIVLCIFNNKTAEEVANTDVESIFSKLDLIRHVSPTRGNGLRAMVKKIQDTAKTLN